MISCTQEAFSLFPPDEYRPGLLQQLYRELSTLTLTLTLNPSWSLVRPSDTLARLQIHDGAGR